MLFYRQYCRIYQTVMRKTMTFLPWRDPRLLLGKNCLQELPSIIVQEGLTRLLFITDRGILKTELFQPLLQQFSDLNIHITIYSDTVANPTIQNVEEAVTLYQMHHCDGIIAFGGGSPIDCAKVVAARVANPHKTIYAMRGLLKVRKKTPILIAVPTTSGTGSEVTLAAVISNNDTNEKFALMDPALLPHIVVLDPTLTLTVPKGITAATGMDALTHAVEAFIGNSNTADTERWSKETVKIIFSELRTVYDHPEHIQARKKMQTAAYLAGKAFTRAYVGNVHAMAHTLSAFYHVPHGVANAVLLPIVLDYYGKSIHKRLAQLADTINLCDPQEADEVKAQAFIQAIHTLNGYMKIPKKLDCIKTKDLQAMAEQAVQEANPLYPVPVIFTAKDMQLILQQV